MIGAMLLQQADEVAREVVQTDVSTLAYIGGVIVPIITAIVTKQVASPVIKALCTAVLATVAGLIAVAIEQKGAIDAAVWIDAIVKSMVAAWASYYGFWRPTTIAPKVQSATAGVGLGKAA